LRLRNHPAGKDEFMGFSIPENFWKYGVNAPYTQGLILWGENETSIFGLE
jgi:hypothetical protein